MRLYEQYSKHYVATDCVIFGYYEGELRLLLYPRGFEPQKGRWSLMGGFVGDNESSDEAAKRILKQTTGLENIYLEQVETFSNPTRDPEARVLSIAYFALIRVDDYDEELGVKHGAQWWPITELPEMVFDHQEMVSKGLLKLQQKSGYSLIGKELLPEKFTLMHLRSLYEAIFQRTFDPGNFRKKILSLDILERLNIKDSSESRKGAYYYKVKEEKANMEVDRIVKI